MARNPQVQTRLPNDDYQRLKDYQEDKDISQAEATRRLIREGLNADRDKKEAVPDGGYLTLSDHPWIDPLVKFAYRSASAGTWIFILSALALVIPGGAVEWYGAELSGETLALFLSVFTIGVYGSAAMIGASAIALLVLEYLMHPSEAPIRRYFYTPQDVEAEVTTT